MADISTTLDNIISHWKLEEASGTRVDATASGNDLSDVNTVGSAVGKIGQAADFEYSNSEYLTITDASQTGLDINSDFSMSAWIKFESLPTTAGQDAGVMAKFSSSGNNRAYGWYFKGEDANKMAVFITPSGASGNRIFVQTSASMVTTGELGTWHHYGVSFDLSSGAVVFYKDGSAVSQSTNNAGTVNSIQNNSLDFRIGHMNQAGAQHIDAIIDECTVTSDIITSGEFSTIYNSGDGIPYAEAAPSFTPTPMLHMLAQAGGVL